MIHSLNEPAVFHSFFSRQSFLTKLDEERFVRTSHTALKGGDRLSLVITLRGTENVIGVIVLTITDWENGCAQIGYWLGRPYWHVGYGSEATSTVCETAFRDLSLHRIGATVFPSNLRSMKLLRRLGFKKEGRRRETHLRGKKRVDEVLFGLLAGDFRRF